MQGNKNNLRDKISELNLEDREDLQSKDVFLKNVDQIFKHTI